MSKGITRRRAIIGFASAAGFAGGAGVGYLASPWAYDDGFSSEGVLAQKTHAFVRGLYADIQGLDDTKKTQNAKGVSEYVLKHLKPEFFGNVGNSAFSMIVNGVISEVVSDDLGISEEFFLRVAGDPALANAIKRWVENDTTYALEDDDIDHLHVEYGFPKDKKELLNGFIIDAVTAPEFLRQVAASLPNVLGTTIGSQIAASDSDVEPAPEPKA